MCTYQSGIQCKPSMLQSYSTVPFDLVRCWRNFIFFFSLAMNCLLVNSKNLGPIKGTWLALTLPFFSPTCTRSNWYGWYQLINGVGLLTLLDWQLNLICIYLLWKTTHKFSLEKLANAFFFFRFHHWLLIFSTEIGKFHFQSAKIMRFGVAIFF